MYTPTPVESSQEKQDKTLPEWVTLAWVWCVRSYPGIVFAQRKQAVAGSPPPREEAMCQHLPHQVLRDKWGSDRSGSGCTFFSAQHSVCDTGGKKP